MKKRKTSEARAARPRVRDIMNENIATIASKVSANVAWTRMRKRNTSHLLVTEDGHYLGTLSEAQLGGGNGGRDVRSRRMVEDLMTPRVVPIEPEATLRQAFNLMREREVSCLLVEEDGQPVGIVTEGEVEDGLGRDPLREPLPGWLPRAEKPEPGTPLQPVPAHIRMLGTGLSKQQRESIREELGARLGKFGNAVERVSVRVEDINGPRGGFDQACRIKAVLSDHPSVVFESRDSSLDVALRRCLPGIEQAVRRKLQRTRMKPIQAMVRSRERQVEQVEAGA